MEMDVEPVPISGMGCVCAAGRKMTEVMEMILAGRREPVISDRIISDLSVSYPVFELSAEVAPAGYYDERECFRCGLLAVSAAREAVDEARIDREQLKELRVGVCIGTTVGNAMNNEGFYRAFLEKRFPDMDSIDDYLRANPADMVADAFGLKGPRQCIGNACASGAVAIGQAAEWIRDGICDIVLAGGADILCRVVYNGFISLKVADTEPCRPFDADRGGLNLGEGAAMLVMESQEIAERRGVSNKAYLCGYGNCSDAYHTTAPHPNGKGLEQAITAALGHAKIGRNEISFINAHGTATLDNDKAEGMVFTRMFPNTVFCSTKGYTGHTLGASGAIEAVIAIDCLGRRMIPASIGFVRSDPSFGVDPVRENTTIYGDYALSDSMAFGGNNAVLIFRKGE